MGGHRYTVEFRIFGNTLDPKEITRELGLQPCQVRNSGSTRSDGKPWSGMWAYDGPVRRPEWDSLSEGLTFLLEKLWPYRETIAKYKASGNLIWWCGHFQSTLAGGPTMSPGLLKRLGEFDAELFIDNYFSRPDEP